MRHALIGFALPQLGRAIQAQNYSSSEYCDPVCLQHGPGSPPDCSYHNYAQCEISRRGAGGDCVQNPFLSLCSRGAAVQQPLHKRKAIAVRPAASASRIMAPPLLGPREGLVRRGRTAHARGPGQRLEPRAPGSALAAGGWPEQ